jgi:hypothetical protein
MNAAQPTSIARKFRLKYPGVEELPLVDQEAVRSGRAANEPWKFYDLGHGYCTYDFFEQCPHRMASAECSFYMPKSSSQAQLLEGKSTPLRLRQEMPLSDKAITAVDDGIAAMERLLESLVDVPTPSGPTPREIDIRSTKLR